jgi:hypothetical protein
MRDYQFFPTYGAIQNNLNQLQGEYYIMREDARRNPWAVVHGIIKHMSFKMEILQSIGQSLGANASGFSDEDLLSNYLGFVSAKHNYTIDDIDFYCSAVKDVEVNTCLFNKLGGLGTNNEWMSPVDYNVELQEVYIEKGMPGFVDPMDFPFYDMLIEAWARNW